MLTLRAQFRSLWQTVRNDCDRQRDCNPDCHRDHGRDRDYVLVYVCARFAWLCPRAVSGLCDTIVAAPMYTRGQGPSVLCVGRKEAFKDARLDAVLDRFGAIMQPLPHETATVQQAAMCVRHSLCSTMQAEGWLIAGNSRLMVSGTQRQAVRLVLDVCRFAIFDGDFSVAEAV